MFEAMPVAEQPATFLLESQPYLGCPASGVDELLEVSLQM
jgi:hypothetical protein